MADKISCQVARDLMPLVIDHACSTESKESVENHVKECPECNQVITVMRSGSFSTLPLPDDATNFKKFVKKQAWKMKKWKILAVLCTIIIAFGGIFVATQPHVIYGLYANIPMRYIENAKLVRTEQGCLMIQMTPSEEYRHFFGYSRYSYGPIDKRSADWSSGGLMEVEYCYAALGMLLGRDFDHPVYVNSYEHNERNVIHLPNGDWLFAWPMSGFRCNYYWIDGEIYTVAFGPATQDELITLMESGVTISGDLQLSRYEKAESWDWEQLEKIQIKCSDGVIALFHKGDEIPLCDQETQAAFDEWIKNVRPSFIETPGEIIYPKG